MESKKINEDSEAPLPIPTAFEENKINNETYTCSDCNSEIEVLSIDDKKIQITFKCLNDNIQNNHGIKIMPIKEYIGLMKKNTFLYSICSVCKKSQKDEKILYNYCVTCKKIFCNVCITEHNQNKHYTIKNNKIGVQCLVHPGNKNTEYCLDCKVHLCIECLKSREHMMHRKNNLIEIMPSEEEKVIVKEYINSLKNKKLNIEEEKK